MLLRTALEDAELHVSAGAQAMPATALDTLARRYMEFQAAARRSPRRHDMHVLEQMLQLPELTAADREDAGKLTAWGAQLELALNAGQPAGRRYTVSLQAGTPPHLLVSRSEHSVTVDKHLHREFFSSIEYRRIAEMARTLSGLFRPGAYIRKGEAAQEVSSFREAMSWMLEQARKGQSIQRYKGLGEMNPAQLWETTMNPENRTLLLVTVEDAAEADRTFDMLMGDAVDPRRKFIQTHAKAVRNLDI
jgi:DNA gyrase subunit B